jgi:hypothetical protein
MAPPDPAEIANPPNTIGWSSGGLAIRDFDVLEGSATTGSVRHLTISFSFSGLLVVEQTPPSLYAIINKKQQAYTDVATDLNTTKLLILRES